jgi:hypothetical protein
MPIYNDISEKAFYSIFKYKEVKNTYTGAKKHKQRHTYTTDYSQKA